MAKRIDYDIRMNPNRTHRLACFVAAVLLGAGAAGAAEPGRQGEGVSTLKPYTAEYNTTALGLGIKLHRQLQVTPDGVYTLTNGGSAVLAGFNETSIFSIEDSTIIPSSYVYQGTGLINRRREVHFTPGSDIVRSLYKGDWYDLAYPPGTLDRMSQQENLRLRLLNSPHPLQEIVVRIADARKIKEYTLSLIGEETLQTPLGPIDTLHYRRLNPDPDRQSDSWLAPSLDYLMVRTLHIENGKPIEIMLTDVRIAEASTTAP